MKRHTVVSRLIVVLAAAELPMVLLIAPALVLPTPARMLLALLVPVTWVCHWYLGGRLIPLTPLNASILVLLVMTGVSLFATFDMGVSMGKASGLVLSLFIFGALTRWMITPRRLQVGTAMFFIVGGGLAIVGLLGMDWIDKFPAFDAVTVRIPRVIHGVSDSKDGFQPNAVAACLVLFVPLQIALLNAPVDLEALPLVLRRMGAWNRVIHVLLLALTAGTLLLTQSRGAWVGLVIATIAFLAWNGRRMRMLATAAAGAILALTVTLGPVRLFELASNQSGPGLAGDVSSRLELWSKAIDGIRDFPLTGMGMNTFRKVMPILYPMVATSPDVEVPHAHNQLLQTALDLGIPGLVAYLAIWLVAAVLLVNVYRHAKARPFRAMACGHGVGLIALFVFNIPHAIPLGSRAGLPFWLTLALVVSLHRVALAARPQG